MVFQCGYFPLDLLKTTKMWLTNLNENVQSKHDVPPPSPCWRLLGLCLRTILSAYLGRLTSFPHPYSSLEGLVSYTVFYKLHCLLWIWNDIPSHNMFSPSWIKRHLLVGIFCCQVNQDRSLRNCKAICRNSVPWCHWRYRSNTAQKTKFITYFITLTVQIESFLKNINRKHNLHKK